MSESPSASADRARKCAIQKAWIAGLPEERREALRAKQRAKMRRLRAERRTGVKPAKARREGLTADQRSTLLRIAPSGDGDHVVSLVGGPSGIVRRDKLGARLVAFGPTIDAALKRLNRAAVGLEHRPWFRPSVADVAA